MIAARRPLHTRAQRTSVGRTAATVTVTAALLTFGLTAAPAQAASAATTTVTDAAGLVAAFAAGGTVTLGADIDVPSTGPALNVVPGHPVTLDLNGQDLSAAGAPYLAGVGVPAGTELVIGDSRTGGSLDATGGDDAAGIGGQPFEDGGTVTITGGTVTAQGGTDAITLWTGGAGIGGGFLGAGGTTTITGGTVTAHGGATAAGIGGGYGGNGGTTTISGGDVTATGGDQGAGIGGGNGGTNGGITTISGGTVTAQAGIYASGIGGGQGSVGVGNGGTVTITGGVVTANGGLQGTAIGGGAFTGDGGALTIGNGAQVTVSASSAPGSFLIGGASNTAAFGSLSNSGSLTITPGSALTIPAGTTVQNSGTIVNNGTISGAGAINNTGAIIGTGSVGSTVGVGANSFELTFDTTTTGPGNTPVTIAPMRVYASTLAAAQLSLPALTAIPHYGFSWSTDAARTTAMTPTTVLTRDLTLYSTFTLDRHIVSFDPQGGSAVASRTTDYGTTIAAPGASSRTGFTLNGWYTAPTGGTKWNFANAVTGDVTLYAQWTAVAVVTPPTPTPTPTPTPMPTATPTATPTPTVTPSAAPAAVDPQLASTGFGGGAAGLGALILLIAGLTAIIVHRRIRKV
ncbi:InlB B-repeat-containing protein [Leifsonia sp. A12D58]|uniref:InlB B-repeat-containing protein n=1 Tax=Leifsonia sp. A12D58 TaxID=3397674 RepID=UPI0039E1F1AA